MLQGRVAIVSGGGTGIGGATTRALRANGAEVVVLGRRREPLDAIAAETGAVVVVGDAAVAADAAAAVRTAVEQFGGLDIVVANAGGGGGGRAGEMADDAWAAALHANLATAYVLCRESLASLVERRGTIVVVSSLAGWTAAASRVGYVTAKHALAGLVKSMARDYGPLGVRANAVCPGWTKTPLVEGRFDEFAAAKGLTREQVYDLVTRDVPLRRAASPDEIASICLFLASDASSYITGVSLLADGGAHAVDLPTLEFDPDRSRPPGWDHGTAEGPSPV